MLEKLIHLSKEHKNMSTLEYWVTELEEEPKSYELKPVLRSLNINIASDPYMNYINNSDHHRNINMAAVQLLLKNGDNLQKLFKTSTNKLAEIFARYIPYAMAELFKICSRLFYFSDSVECSELRSMTINDSEYTTANNTRLMLSTVQADSHVLSTEQVQELWAYMESLAVVKGSWSHEALCGEWKANEDEDVISRHILLIHNDQLPRNYSINITWRELCRTCSGLCGSSSKIYSEWYIEEYKLNTLVDAVYSVGLLMSVLFLVLTFLVFTLVPRLRSSLHGKCTLYHLISMITAYTTLALPQLIHHLFKTHPSLCLVIGHIMQYGFLAMFFWLNVMCFDILLAFCFLKNRKSMSRKERRAERSKLFWYCCYGWGGPLIILVVTLVLEYTDVMDPDSYLKPEIGGPKCFFQDKDTQWLFLYGPIGCLILTNLIMFAITAVKIYCHSKNTDLIQQSYDNSASNKGDNNRLKVYINLFILMGVNWAAEALSWILPRSEWFSYLTDITTTLQGVAVFILFVCKPRVIRDVRIKLGWLSNQSSSITQSGNRETDFREITSHTSKSSGKDLACQSLKSLDEK